MPAITVIQLRRDTAANWASTNPVLAAGEAGLETDTDLVKYGDGASAWVDLQYPTTSRVSQLAKNDTGASVTKGQAVYISGANGANALFSLADADAESTSSKTVGLLVQDLATNGIGSIITEGLLTGLNTSAATVGQSVWLSGTAGDRVYGAPPAKPAHSVYLGVVTRAHATQGSILVKVQNGYELNELHDVNAGSPADNNVLAYDATSSMWTNQTAAEAGLETPTGSQAKADAAQSAAISAAATDATTKANAAKSGAETTAANALSAHEADTTSVHGIADTAALATKTYADSAVSTAVAGLTKSSVGLGNVDNTSDANKPISSATQTALDAKASNTALSSHEADTTNIHGIADTSLLATKAYADNAAATAAAAIVDAAPGTLDTLNELAAAINDDASFAATVTTALGNKQDKVTGVSDTEIGYLDGVTSAIQTQIDGKAATSHTHTISQITDYTPVDISGKQDKVTGVSDTEIGYLDGVTSAIQTQLDAKAPTEDAYLINPGLSSPILTGNLITNDGTTITTLSLSEVNALDGVTSNIQTQIDGKAASTHTHAQSDITGLSTALSGKQDKVTGVSDTEIGYLDGVTSAIQAQIDGKVSNLSPTFNGVTMMLQSEAQAGAPAALVGFKDSNGDAVTAFSVTGLGDVYAANLAVGTIYDPTISINMTGNTYTISSSELMQLDGLYENVQNKLSQIGAIASPTDLGVVYGSTVQQSGTDRYTTLGYNATAAASGVALGESSSVTGSNSTGIALGTLASSTGTGIAIGSESTAADAEIVLGTSAQTKLKVPGVGLDTTTATNGKVLGWDTVSGTTGFVWKDLPAAGISANSPTITDPTFNITEYASFYTYTSGNIWGWDQSGYGYVVFYDSPIAPYEGQTVRILDDGGHSAANPSSSILGIDLTINADMSGFGAFMTVFNVVSTDSAVITRAQNWFNDMANLGSAVTLGAGSTNAITPTEIAALGSLSSTAVSSNITLAKGKFFVDTTAARTLTLPASPSLGDEIQVFDASGSAGTNNITVARNGNKINGLTQDAALDANGVAATFVYTGSTYGWRLG